MAVKSIKTKDLVWHNISELDQESLHWLKKEYKFHPLNINDCQGENEHPKIDYYKDNFFIVLHFPDIDKKRGIVYTHEIDIFVGEKYLITIHKQKDKTLNNIFYRLTTNLSARYACMNEGTGVLLYKILDEMCKKFTVSTQHIYVKIDQTERKIFEDESTASIQTLADIRRMVLKLRLILNPQRILISSLLKLNVKFFSKEMELYFDDIRDYLEKMWAIADNQKDLVDGLYETNESMLSHRTNRVIKILTIFSVSMLPLTLLTGVYGMNISLPYDHSPFIVWSIFGFLMLIIVGIVFYFKNKDLI